MRIGIARDMMMIREAQPSRRSGRRRRAHDSDMIQVSNFKFNVKAHLQQWQWPGSGRRGPAARGPA
jgi:hypothetical protein